MGSLDIYSLDNSDDTLKQVIAVIGFGVNVAVQSDLCTVETRQALRVWMHAETQRMNPKRDARKNSLLSKFRNSRWFVFWSTLVPEQEVRWTDIKTATYFVVTGDLLKNVPDGRPGRYWASGPWVQLRRQSGRTFWTHISKVRPVDSVS